jgi:hypothetical protein
MNAVNIWNGKMKTKVWDKWQRKAVTLTLVSNHVDFSNIQRLTSFF